MIERQQQETLRTSEISIPVQDIVWEGRPSFLPFLLSNEKLITLTFIWFLLFWYFDFTWFLPTKIWGCFWGFFLIQGSIYWHRFVQKKMKLFRDILSVFGQKKSEYKFFSYNRSFFCLFAFRNYSSESEC